MTTTVVVPAKSSCNYCQKSCRLRCSRCREVYYCSLDCQKSDWKKHKLQCLREQHQNIVAPPSSTARAFKAWKELEETLQNLSLDDAQKGFHIASAEKKRLESEEKSQMEITSDIRTPPANDKTNTSHSNNCFSDKTSVTRKKTSNKQMYQQEINSTDKSLAFDKYISSFGVKPNREFDYVVEEMTNLSCYLITVRSTHSDDFFKCEDLELFVKEIDDKNTIVSLRQKGSHENSPWLLSLIFPTRLVHDDTNPGRIHVERDGSICIRLQSMSQIIDYNEAGYNSITTTDELNSTLRCRFCDQLILAKSSLSRLLPLPEKNWDEITDYLICYNGQPMIDFSSSSTEVQRGMAFQDPGVLVLHREDMGHSVCVLAVDGYGEEEANSNMAEEVKSIDEANKSSIMNRGSRPWHDSVGGATVCCSQCCSTLGFASITSPDTFRLLKHRLSVGALPINENKYNIHTCSTFIAREMVRYAESKAIFTFVAVVKSNKDDQMKKTSMKQHKSSTGKCLLLKILSWETKIARRSTARQEISGVARLNFSNMAKVCFEETLDHHSTETGDNNKDPTKWIWGGVDLCCQPPVSSSRGTFENENATTNQSINNPKNASVRLYLTQEEWLELRQMLVDGSSIFSRTVSEATVLLRLGKTLSSADKAGLSALPLL